MAGEERSANEAWYELQDLLRAASSDAPQPRGAAALYTSLRDQLTRSELQDRLPGFMLQCLTLDRFRDFIHLYDPNPETRLELLNRAFGVRNGRSRLNRDFFADVEF